MGEKYTCVKDLACRMEITRSAVWRLCHRFNERGLDVLNDAPRPGRPRGRTLEHAPMHIKAPLEESSLT